jgi:tRNA(Arg) A34 adenosine deaminase TadA
MGTAKPCWRCLEWCKWSGVKRIFHWNERDGRWDVVKVNSVEKDLYETHSDVKLYAGLVRFSSSLLHAGSNPLISRDIDIKYVGFQ